MSVTGMYRYVLSMPVTGMPFIYMRKLVMLTSDCYEYASVPAKDMCILVFNYLMKFCSVGNRLSVKIA